MINTYVNYYLILFAEDVGFFNKSFHWDEVRRVQLRAELDAYYARLYGLTRAELRYILAPKEVHGEDPSTLPCRAVRAAFPWLNLPYGEGEGGSAKYYAARNVDSLLTQTDISSGGGIQ